VNSTRDFSDEIVDAWDGTRTDYYMPSFKIVYKMARGRRRVLLTKLIATVGGRCFMDQATRLSNSIGWLLYIGEEFGL
jgi:hypothetical protein